jgi:hypothetical protein
MSCGQSIFVTPIGATNKVLWSVSNIFSIFENKAGTKTFIRFVGAKETIEVVESLTAIFNQQNTTGNNLNMVLTTNASTSRRVIYFTHHMYRITESGEGAKITFKPGYATVYTVETLADIYAYQGAAGAKNLGMVFCTRASDSANFILFSCDIRSIYPYPLLTGAVTGAKISFESDQEIITTQTPAQLYAAQPL